MTSNKKKINNFKSNNKQNNTSKKPPNYIVKKIINENDIEDCSIYGDTIMLNDAWNVFIHSNTNSNWDISSFDHIYRITSIGSLWRFLNNFSSFDKIKNQIFLFRSGILPIWEDIANKNGGVLSIKFDYFHKNGRNDIGTEIMMCLTILILNECFIENNKIINGINFSIKNKSIIIKLWINVNDSSIQSLIPHSLFKIFNDKLNVINALASADQTFDYNTYSNNIKNSQQQPNIIPNFISHKKNMFVTFRYSNLY